MFAWMLMAFLIIFGLLGFLRLGVSQLPDVDFPTVSISVNLEGASPEIMETDVVDVIESAMIGIEGVRDITASARHARASVTVEFGLERDIDAAVQDVQTKLAQSMRQLPREIDPPNVSKFNPEDQPIMFLGLSGHVPIRDLAAYARDVLKDRFQTVPGVGEVSMGGYLERSMRVWLKLNELESRQLAVDEVLSALQREHVEIPVGRIETTQRELNVRMVGEALSAEEFRKIVIAYRNEAPVLLSDVAIIEDGLEDIRRLARANGVPAIGMGIRKQRGANAVEVANAVRKRMDEIQGQIPAGMELGVNFDSTRFVEESIDEIKFTLLLAAILTGFVCWLFLGSWSATFNILLAIPTSILGTFIVMYFLGFTMNTFTLLALSLAIGIVVDDAIMVLENIVRHRDMGKDRARAASEGARQITFAAMAATVALIAIFLPIAFMEGVIGKFLFQFGVVISVAVALSLLEALTLTPMRCSVWMEERRRSSRLGLILDGSFRRLAGTYRRLLGLSLRARALVIVGSIAAFGGSMWLALTLNVEMVPAQDQSTLMVRIKTPVGSSLDYTDSRVRKVEEFMLSRSEVKRVMAIIGGFGGGEVDTGMMFVTMHPPGQRGPRPITQQDFMNEARRGLGAIPGVSAYPSDMSMRGLGGRGSQFPIEFVVTGPEWKRLAEDSETIMDKMRDTGVMLDVNSDYLVGMPEVKILPDRRRAADLGVSVESIARTTNAFVGGVRAGKFKEGGHRYDVRVRLVSDQRSRPEDVKRLFVRSRDGGLVRLSEVVQVFEEPTLQSISRRNRARAITIRANVLPGQSQKAVTDRAFAIAKEVLPAGYRADLAGSSQMFSETAWAFVFALIMGWVVAYMVLASQFNSFVHPVLVLIAMPFSLTGAIVALWLWGLSLNMYSMIGVVLLMGIVKKNSILLVEFTNHKRAEGLAVDEALVEACPIRLRPILMTSLATIAAAVPAAMALGPGAETRIPMAVVVIGGVLFSTLLTLFVVPCAYSLIPGRVREEKGPEVVG
ncbi:MAG TPA: efflux RND transporter permease subunit [Planctomycetota bacterium]|nr:efflux RND transporter permease subunit [Planctomycetota bacterium]